MSSVAFVWVFLESKAICERWKRWRLTANQPQVPARVSRSFKNKSNAHHMPSFLSGPFSCATRFKFYLPTKSAVVVLLSQVVVTHPFTHPSIQPTSNCMWKGRPFVQHMHHLTHTYPVRTHTYSLTHTLATHTPVFFGLMFVFVVDLCAIGLDWRPFVVRVRHWERDLPLLFQRWIGGIVVWISHTKSNRDGSSTDSSTESKSRQSLVDWCQIK